MIISQGKITWFVTPIDDYNYRWTVINSSGNLSKEHRYVIDRQVSLDYISQWKHNSPTVHISKLFNKVYNKNEIS